MSSPQSPTNEKTISEKSTEASTVAAQLTGPGRSAIAVISIAGDLAAHAIDQSFRRATPPPMLPGQIRYGTWLSGESIVITPIANDHFEIHCHGGQAAIDVILSDLRKAGIKIAESFAANPQKPLLIQEAESVLIHCTTAHNAAIAMDQVRGAMQDWATHCRPTAPPSASSPAAKFNNVKPGPAERSVSKSSPHAPRADNLESARGACGDVSDQARLMLSYAPLTTHLTIPFQVVLVGAPNVGKSSLTNAILGYDRSITMNTAGTTRDVLHAETVISGIPIRISDTAGIREDIHANQADDIEREGIRRAIQEIETADLVIRVRDPDTDFAIIPAHINSIDITNKYDLLSHEPTALAAGPSPTAGSSMIHAQKEEPAASAVGSAVSATAVSAITGHGIPELFRRITDQLAQHRPPPGAPAPINARQTEALRRISTADDADEVIAGLSQLIGLSPDLGQLEA